MAGRNRVTVSTFLAAILVQGDVIWEMVQFLCGFMFSAHFCMQNDLAGDMNMILEGKVQLKASKEEMLEM